MHKALYLCLRKSRATRFSCKHLSSFASICLLQWLQFLCELLLLSLTSCCLPFTRVVVGHCFFVMLLCLPGDHPLRPFLDLSWIYLGLLTLRVVGDGLGVRFTLWSCGSWSLPKFSSVLPSCRMHALLRWRWMVGRGTQPGQGTLQCRCRVWSSNVGAVSE